MRSAITSRFAKQIYIAGPHFCCILHFILQLLGLRIAQSFCEPTLYGLKVGGRIMGPNNRKDMGSNSSNGITIEGFEVFPCCLAPLNEGVRVLPPAVMLSGHLQVDAVKHRLNCGDYNIEILLLDPGLLHQHVELHFGFMMIACESYNDPLYKEATSTVIPTRRSLPFSSSASLSARSASFAFSWQS